MKRTITSVTGLAAAALLVLAGCGSETGGTAAPAAGSSSTVSESSSATTSDTGSSDETSDAGTSGPETSDSDTSAGGSSTGAGSGSADQQSVAWFETLCSGVAPLKDLQNVGSEIDQADPLGSLKKIAPKFSAAGKSLVETARKLKDLPAPTFDGGDTYAKQVTESFGTIGQKLVDLGTKLVDLDPSDPSAASELTDIGTTLTDASKPLQQLGDLPADGKAALAAAPSCQALSG
ncbi:MAG: hypothetical protein WKF57_04770 [Nakamurella sp.]